VNAVDAGFREQIEGSAVDLPERDGGDQGAGHGFVGPGMSGRSGNGRITDSRPGIAT
jgi:hypothetical protein